MRYLGFLFIGLILTQCTGEVKNPTPTYTEEELVTYRESGLETAMATKAALGSVLIPTVTQEGTVAALEFCNIKAIPLTDSMSVDQNKVIYRVSDKPRNHANLANEMELEYIASAKENIALGETVTPAVHAIGDRVIGYYPILTNQFCLQCHGNPGEKISEETLAAIQRIYPEDKATGYSEGEIRGIFVVEMEGKQE